MSKLLFNDFFFNLFLPNVYTFNLFKNKNQKEVEWVIKTK
jgi:hypothetical protein